MNHYQILLKNWSKLSRAMKLGKSYLSMMDLPMDQRNGLQIYQFKNPILNQFNFIGIMEKPQHFPKDLKLQMVIVLLPWMQIYRMIQQKFQT